MGTCGAAAVMMCALMAQPEQAGPLILPSSAAALGDTRAALDRAHGRLCSPPLSDQAFVLSDVSFELKRRFNEYSGDVSGRMLGALQAAEAALGMDEAFDQQLLERLPEYQKADGHFGADQDLAAGISQQRDTPILWGNSRLLLGFAQRAALSPSPAAIAMARKIGDYVITTHRYYGKRENFESVGGVYSSGYTTCYPALIEGLVELGVVTGEAKYLDEARSISQLALLDQAFEKHHSHGRLSAYRGMLLLDRATGRREFLPFVRAGCGRIMADFMLPTGGITETFDRTDTRDEGCTEADWVIVNLLMWEATGEAGYLETAEHVLNNHVLAAELANGGYGHQNLRVSTVAGKRLNCTGFAAAASDSYWCCSMHITQMLAELPRWAVVLRGRDLYVTLLAEARCRFGADGPEVTVTTAGPNEWVIESSRPVVGELLIRRPTWAAGMRVNGENVDEITPWIRCPSTRGDAPERVWRIKLEPELRVLSVHAGLPAKPNAVRLLWGKDVLCLPDLPEQPEPTADAPVPSVILSEAGPDRQGRLQVMVLEPGAGQRPALLVPMFRRPHGGCRFIFQVAEQRTNIPQVPDPLAALVPIEVMVALEGKAEIWLNGRTIGWAEGWGESPRIAVWARRGHNVLAVRCQGTGERPALIGRIIGAAGQFDTSPQTWSFVSLGSRLDPEWLLDAKAGPGAVELGDLGGFGTPPWLHLPAGFAASPARWIWPREHAARPDGWWLARCGFEAR